MSKTIASSTGDAASQQKKPYEILSEETNEDMNAKHIWQSKVPNKINAWLVFKGRLNTTINLTHKSRTAPPRCSHPTEDTDHLFISCPLTDRIWQWLSIYLHFSGMQRRRMAGRQCMAFYPTRDSLVYLGRQKCKGLNLDSHSSLTLKHIVSDLDLWSHRLHK